MPPTARVLPLACLLLDVSLVVTRHSRRGHGNLGLD
jgi:hypothetical protein